MTSFSSSQKLFCYVDETGQDTQGRFFVVSVIIGSDDQQKLREILAKIEQHSGKGQVKWIKAPYARRVLYCELLATELSSQAIKLNFATYKPAQDYLALTAKTIELAILRAQAIEARLTIFIDGLPRTLERQIGTQLRSRGLRIKKVRGVKKDENDALIRLADAVCGLIRGADEGQPEMQTIIVRLRAQGLLSDVS